MQVELESIKARVKETSSLLIAELQSELLLSVETFKSDGFSVTEAVERLKRVAAVVDKLVITPIKTEVSALTPPEAVATGGCAEEAVDDEATNGTPAPDGAPTTTNMASDAAPCKKAACKKKAATPAVAPTAAPTEKPKVVDSESEADEPMEDATDSPEAL